MGPPRASSRTPASVEATRPNLRARVPALLLGGSAFGALLKLADGSGELWLSDLTSSPALFVVIAAAIGHWSLRVGGAAANALLFFVPMVVTYYLIQDVVLAYGLGPYAFAWLAAAVVVAAPLAAAMCWSRGRRGILGAVVPAVAAGMVLADGYILQFTLLGIGGVTPHHLVQACLEVVMAAGICFMAAGWRARILAALLVAPVAAVGIRLTDTVLYGTGLIG